MKRCSTIFSAIIPYMIESKPSKKRLYRSRTERMIAGVCGGIANYFNTDPVWIRVLFLVLLIAAGSTLLIYLILWLIVPLEPGSGNGAEQA